MVQAILGLKAATEKAAAGKPERPATEAVIAAFEGIAFETRRAARSTMKLGKGHQAIQSIAYGTFKFDRRGQPSIVDIVKLRGRVREPAGGRQERRVDQGRLPGRQVQLNAP